jgi:hypothetical protein
MEEVMADEGNNNEGNSTPGASDGSEEKNIKAEFNRKLADLNANLTAQNANLAQQMQTLLQTIESRQTAGKSSAGAEKKLEELMYDNPTEFVNKIRTQIKDEVQGDNYRTQSFNQAAALLDSEYPEFRDRSSEQRKRVEAYYAQLPQSLQNTKEGLEVAVYKAAADFGLTPQSKRSKGNDDFSMSGSGSSSGNNARKQSKKSGEMAADQAAFAELIGAPVNDPKFKAEFEKATGRSYGKFK